MKSLRSSVNKVLLFKIAPIIRDDVFWQHHETEFTKAFAFGSVVSEEDTDPSINRFRTSLNSIGATAQADLAVLDRELVAPDLQQLPLAYSNYAGTGASCR